VTGPKSGKVASRVPLSQLVVVAAEAGVREMLHSLGLLCLVSLLLALLSLVFLLKISPMPPRTANASVPAQEQLLSAGEYRTVYEVTVAMCSLTLCLNLSCLLVCAIQFLFAAKLIRSRDGRIRYVLVLVPSTVQ
jgi:hypothetical protein